MRYFNVVLKFDPLQKERKKTKQNKHAKDFLLATLMTHTISNNVLRFCEESLYSVTLKISLFFTSGGVMVAAGCTMEQWAP